MIHSWSIAMGPGNLSYKKFVPTSCLLHILADEYIYRLLLSSTTFNCHPKYPIVNLSHINSAFVSTGMHGEKHFHCVGNNQPLLCTLVVMVDQCYLNEGKITEGSCKRSWRLHCLKEISNASSVSLVWLFESVSLKGSCTKMFLILLHNGRVHTIFLLHGTPWSLF
jgi:hypothetical protein